VLPLKADPMLFKQDSFDRFNAFKVDDLDMSLFPPLLQEAIGNGLCVEKIFHIINDMGNLQDL
jgi:hypothetical protein